MTVQRHCSNCGLCCRLVPVEEIKKPAGKKCQYSRHGQGCIIYTRRPMSCQAWSCRWLVNDDTADIPRPDHGHYVIDTMPDVLIIDEKVIPCIQVWCDPAHRDAHRDPALRRYIERRAQQDDMLTIVRFNAWEGLVLFAPSTNPDNKWYEVPSNAKDSKSFTARVAAVQQMEGGSEG